MLRVFFSIRQCANGPYAVAPRAGFLVKEARRLCEVR